MHYSESSGNNLPKVIAQGTGTGRDLVNTSISIGFDHSAPSAINSFASSRDASSLMGTRHKEDESLFGATIYDGLNQATGKYNRNTPHVKHTYGETISAVVWNAAEWANAGSQPYNLDAPVVAPLKDNISFSQKDTALLLQISTFSAPVAYNRADAYATRKTLRLQSDNWSYVSNTAPLGHRDGDISHNPYGGVVDSDDNAYIMTQNSTGTYPAFCGTRYFVGFCNDPLTMEQSEKLQVNLYKVL